MDTSINLATKFVGSTAMAHANDLYHVITHDIITMRQYSASLGPDILTRSLIVMMYIGSHWHATNLDILVSCSYAPGHSAEHAWSPLSWCLVGVTLAITLPGEDTPPCQQIELSDEEVATKEKHMFGGALDLIVGYWSGMTYDGVNQGMRKTLTAAVALYLCTVHIIVVDKYVLKISEQALHVLAHCLHVCAFINIVTSTSF